MIYLIIAKNGKKKDELKPSGVSIKGVFPNPFNSETTIEYEISSLNPSILTELAIFNITGQKICLLVSEKKAPGIFSARWNGKDTKGFTVSTGIYFANLQAGNAVYVNKILFVK